MLNVRQKVKTWRGTELELLPAPGILRTQVHLYHHQVQILAMCRLLGRPTTGMQFFPLD